VRQHGHSRCPVVTGARPRKPGMRPDQRLLLQAGATSQGQSEASAPPEQGIEQLDYHHPDPARGKIGHLRPGSASPPAAIGEPASSGPATHRSLNRRGATHKQSLENGFCASFGCRLAPSGFALTIAPRLGAAHSRPHASTDRHRSTRTNPPNSSTTLAAEKARAEARQQHRPRIISGTKNSTGRSPQRSPTPPHQAPQLRHWPPRHLIHFAPPTPPTNVVPQHACLSSWISARGRRRHPAPQSRAVRSVG